MSQESSTGSSAQSIRSRGRGKSRGGLGKYLRARGRGRGGGRAAEFHQRLVLEDEEITEIDPDSEEYKAQERKYSKRQITSNADRYIEPAPALNSDGEAEEEPEVDLSSFLARQRLDSSSTSVGVDLAKDDDDEVDTTLSHFGSKPAASSRNFKGKVQHIEWDDKLDDILREKEAADANRNLKARFKESAKTQKMKPIQSRSTTKWNKNDDRQEAPPLPVHDPPPVKSEKEEMEDFLDDLLD